VEGKGGDNKERGGVLKKVCLLSAVGAEVRRELGWKNNVHLA